MKGLVAFTSGVLFAVGLELSGMTRPDVVLGFLDVTGAWNPSLAFVMVGALIVYAAIWRWARKAAKPLGASGFRVSTRTKVDRRLVAGSVMFGIGWGLAGYCPGPILTSLTSFDGRVLIVFGGMVMGMLAVQWVTRAVLRRR